MAELNTQWFSGDQRTEASLADYKLLKSRGSERRQQFHILIPLDPDGQLVGAPEWIINACERLQKGDTKASEFKYSKDDAIGGLTVEFWSTPQTKARFFPALVGCTIRPVAMIRVGKGEEVSEVSLKALVYAPASKEVHDWIYDMQDGHFYVNFDQVQGELDLSGEDTADEDDEDLTGPEHDEEFGAPQSQSAKAAAKRKAGGLHSVN